MLALLGIGEFSAQAQQRKVAATNSRNPLVPAFFDCSQLRALGIDKQENLRAGAIAIYCGEALGGSPDPSSDTSQFVQELLAPLFGTVDQYLVTGAESFPHITQSETFTAGNPDNPNEIVVAYNDSRGVFDNPINISGASVSTDGGNNFTRLTTSNGQSPFADTFGDPVILYNRPTGTWYTVWLDAKCGGQGLGGYKSTNPSDPIAGPIILAFTPTPATTASLAGRTITRAALSMDGCMSLLTTSIAGEAPSSFATPPTMERPGLTSNS